MFYILKKGPSIKNIEIINNKDSSVKDFQFSKKNIIKCFNEEELFLKLLNIFQNERYWKIIDIIRKFEIEVSDDYLIKSYCSKSARLRNYKGEFLYLLIDKQNHFSKTNLFFICTDYEYSSFKDKDIYFSLKIQKELLPFCLSFLLKKFTDKDFYFCFKNITNIKNIPTFNSNSNIFFIVKNKSKIISYHTSYDSAIKVFKMIENENLTEYDFFKLEIKKVKDYEEFINLIDDFKIQKSSVFNKYMIDYDWYFDYCLSKKYIDISKLKLNKDVFLIRDKNGKTVVKENELEMYNFVKDNKLYSEDIFLFENEGFDFDRIDLCFKNVKKEFSHDNLVTEHLEVLDYFEKVKILKELTEIILNNKQQEDINYSYLYNFVDNTYSLLFFKDTFSFNKHITSLDLNFNSLSYGVVTLKSLRRILKPHSHFCHSERLSRTDMSFNVSNLFTNNDIDCRLLKPLKDMDIIVDVDAFLKNNKSACGIVIRDKNNEITTKISKKLNANTSVEAEIEGAIFALKYVTTLEPNIKNICLRYDCFSVADYLISTPCSDIGTHYRNFIKKLLIKHPDLQIYIKKVKGHSSDFFNDIADSLAGNFFNEI